jgi:hypothetical protein
MSLMATTIVDLEALRQRQEQTFREQLLHLRMLSDCLGDIELDLRCLVERLEENPRRTDLRAAGGVKELSERVTAITARLVETLANLAL